ncbi:ATP-binding protein [Rhodococcus sp. NPDC058514]|uniref:ATP-binding protein n=1 Tax=unclassified Rhodococcus (in: high G+C Gram-positive bacteria) TaxID=192944 RepID=UPI00365DEF8A
MEPTLDAIQDHRHELYQRFATAQVAVSTDGREVSFMGPVETGVEVGGFAVIEFRGDRRVVVQVREVHMVEREGPALDFTVRDGMAELGVVSARARPLMRALSGTATTLGEFDGARFVGRREVEPFGERPIRPAGEDEVAAIAEGLAGTASSFEIGVLQQASTVPARLRSTGFARHTFMCGQSGSGKTYTTGGLLERLLASTELPIVVLDPNSDHVFLGSCDPEDCSPAAARHREVSAGVHVARARGYGAAHTLCLDFSDLDLDTQALLLRMDPIRDLDEFRALRQVTATLTAPYSVDDLEAAAAAHHDTERLAARIGNLRIGEWDLWRRGDERSAVEYDMRGARCVVVDVGSLSRPDERTAVALAILGRRWAGRRDRDPVLLVIDEAHNVLPAVTDDPLLAATAELGALIAGEGRKFGLHLFVATQRPGKVHPNVVSQCDNLVLMRMNGAADIKDLSALFSHVPAPMLHRATGFGLGQALFAGPIAPVPLLAQVGTRVSPEGGGDVPTTWAG